MAKNSKNQSNETATQNTDDGADQFERLRKALSAPETFEKRGGDLVGFWDPDFTPIHCIPRSVKLFDGNIEPDKPSILLTVELVKAAGVRPPKDAEGGEAPFAAPPGSLVGVWYKPGMRAIRDLCGVPVWMTQEGEKDTGKPNPMKLFDVRSDKTGTRIPVTEDTREESKPYEKEGKWRRLTDFDVRPGARGTHAGNMTDEEATALLS
jgi:hypothetical protein